MIEHETTLHQACGWARWTLKIFSPVVATLSMSVVLVVLLAMLLAELRPAETLRVVLFDHAQKAMFAAVAMASSLYFSEVVGFTPGEFCWFQRIAMHPLPYCSS